MLRDVEGWTALNDEAVDEWLEDIFEVDAPASGKWLEPLHMDPLELLDLEHERRGIVISFAQHGVRRHKSDKTLTAIGHIWHRHRDMRAVHRLVVWFLPRIDERSWLEAISDHCRNRWSLWSTSWHSTINGLFMRLIHLVNPSVYLKAIRFDSDSNFWTPTIICLFKTRNFSRKLGFSLTLTDSVAFPSF